MARLIRRRASSVSASRVASSRRTPSSHARACSVEPKASARITVARAVDTGSGSGSVRVLPRRPFSRRRSGAPSVLSTRMRSGSPLGSSRSRKRPSGGPSAKPNSSWVAAKVAVFGLLAAVGGAGALALWHRDRVLRRAGGHHRVLDLAQAAEQVGPLAGLEYLERLAARLA